MDEKMKALLRSILADCPSASYIPHESYGMEAIQLTGKGGERITFVASSPDYGDWTIAIHAGEIKRDRLSSAGTTYDAMKGIRVPKEIVEV